MKIGFGNKIYFYALSIFLNSIYIFYHIYFDFYILYIAAPILSILVFGILYFEKQGIVSENWPSYVHGFCWILVVGYIIL